MKILIPKLYIDQRHWLPTQIVLGLVAFCIFTLTFTITTVADDTVNVAVSHIFVGQIASWNDYSDAADSMVSILRYVTLFIFSAIVLLGGWVLQKKSFQCQ